MNGLWMKIKASLHEEKGQTLVEYALLLMLIALVVILMLKGTGLTVNSMYSNINSQVGGL